MQTDVTATISGASTRTAVEKMFKADGEAPLDAHYVVQIVTRARACGTSDAVISAVFGLPLEQVSAVPQ